MPFTRADFTKRQLESAAIYMQYLLEGLAKAQEVLDLAQEYCTRTTKEPYYVDVNSGLSIAYSVDDFAQEGEEILRFFECGLRHDITQTRDVPEQSHREFTFDHGLKLRLYLTENSPACQRILVREEVRKVPVYEFRCEETESENNIHS